MLCWGEFHRSLIVTAKVIRSVEPRASLGGNARLMRCTISSSFYNFHNFGLIPVGSFNGCVE
jgi:hypothetical protein